jgi:hypothetical protein
MSAATRHPSLDELSAWADGEIADEVERRLLDEHVAGCPSCASLVADFRALAGAQASAPVPPVPARLAERVRAALREEGGDPRHRRRFVLPLSAAATLLVGVVALWLVRHRPEVPLPSAAIEQAPARDAAPPTLQAPGAGGARAKTEGKFKVVEAPATTAPSSKETASPSFAPAPPAEPEPQAGVPGGVEGGVPGGVLGGVVGGVAEDREEAAERQRRRVSLRLQDARWTRVVPEAATDDLSKTGAERAEARADAPAATAPSASAAPEESVDRLAAAIGPGGCPTVDALEPPLVLAGLDLERARQLGEAARTAGALSTSTDAGANLTLLVRPQAWTRVRQVLVEAGVVVPASAEAPPAEAACLSVTVVPAAP